MPKSVKISEARRRLPALARYLARHPDQVVLVEHRDLDERLALTTEVHIQHLERVAAELRRQTTRSFKLAGSIGSKLTDSELEAALQKAMRQQADLREQKIEKLSSS